jgi:hypothetical protein
MENAKGAAKFCQTLSIHLPRAIVSRHPPLCVCEGQRLTSTWVEVDGQSHQNNIWRSSDTLPLSTKELLLPFLRYLAVVSLLFAQCVFARADSLSELSNSFWQWRAQEQPFSDDDIPRIERPAGLVVDWSSQTITQRLQQLDTFEQRWKALAPPGANPNS